MVTKGEGGGEGQITCIELTDITTIHKIDKQQGFTVSNSELYSVSCNNLCWNII